MAEKNAKATQDKKKELEAELKALEERLGTAFSRVKDDVEGQVERTRNSVSPAWWVRRYPGYVLAAAVVAGFLIAPRRQRTARRYNKEASPERTQTVMHAPGTADLITGEIKRLLMRKATNFLVDKIEETIDRNFAPKKKREP
ncbi:MAG: hypothetical protein LAT75_11540 [Candidatus Cyclonatronum sp.]|uniref:hypothetical protein n=1 Tax=Cyclonatronum sp. TaxID=3024185 RepID=UPI0025BC4EB7|nr:hypothetical protein [Cyclonatronum sp.]MCC5933390.1 hypothetical protein [Balneolales bacterium]MCH8487490.1 hypothetical protein [Cyclonatronum sp.]